MSNDVTKGNISISDLNKINKSIKDNRRACGKKSPTPPSPQNPTARFKFFTGPQGKDYGPAVIHKEMQRYAWTPQGNKYFRELKKQQHETQLKQVEKDNEMKILPPKKGLLNGIKNIFKSQRGS